MSPRRSVLIALAAVVAAAVAGGLVLSRQHARAADSEVRAAAERVATAVAAGDVAGLKFEGGTDVQAQSSFAAATKGLGASTTNARVSAVRRHGGTARAALVVRRSLPGGTYWVYHLPLRLVLADGSWRLPADQRLVHPDVALDEGLRVRRETPIRADVLGAGDQALVTLGDVVDVGIQRNRVLGPVAALTAKVAKVVDVDPAALTQRVQAASTDAFVEVITLRRADYAKVRPLLHPLPGVVFRDRQEPLAPTRDFARALLGTVGPVTAELVSESKGRYVAGDTAGLSGLQRQYEEQLAGTPTVTVEVLPLAAASGGSASRVLFRQDGEPSAPLRLTLDPTVQLAADAALQGLSSPAALVALDTRTGAVLAVANSPTGGLDRAMVGRYPPGSTFKMVTTLKLLQDGLQPTDPVGCPASATVDGRRFKNYENEQLGTVPFRVSFARSCNTAFVGLSSRLGADDLTNAARSLGIGADWQLGAPAFTGSVPASSSDVDTAAAAFGQGRVLVSPLAVTVATASVARGSFLPPTLVVHDATAPTGVPTASPTAVPLSASAVASLHSLMRSVVTDGTGTALKNVPGGPVHAKTGTAEYGLATPPRTRAWVTGWQGHVAFTAFVEEGRSGGTVAGPVAATFLTLLAR